MAMEEEIEKQSDTEIKITTTREKIVPVSRLLEEKEHLIGCKERLMQQVSETDEAIAKVEAKLQRAKELGIDMRKYL